MVDSSPKVALTTEAVSSSFGRTLFILIGAQVHHSSSLDHSAVNILVALQSLHFLEDKVSKPCDTIQRNKSVCQSVVHLTVFCLTLSIIR